MKIYIYISILSALFLVPSLLFSCPFTITNDSKSPILIMNPNDKVVLHLEQNKTGVIDASIPGWFLKYFVSEKLDLYIFNKQLGLFEKRYQLKEAYCVKDFKTANALKLSKITALVKNPTDRLSVEMIVPRKIDRPNHHH